MKSNNLIIIYLLVFAAVLILLRMIGTIIIGNEELLGYMLIIYGLGLFYSSFIRKKKISVFIGSGLFLFGVFLILLGNFELGEIEQILIPTIIFILAISSLMLYLMDTNNRTALTITSILFATAIGVFAIYSTRRFNNYFGNLINVLGVYWPVIIILVIVIILVNRESEEKL